MSNVVNLREAPPLTDVPGMLRHLADKIESGDVLAESALIVVPTEEDWPDVYGFGDHLSDLEAIGLLELAKAFMLNCKTSRA